MISLKTRSIVVLTDEQTHLISGGSDNTTTANATNGTTGATMASVECPPDTVYCPPDNPTPPGYTDGGCDTIMPSQMCEEQTDGCYQS